MVRSAGTSLRIPSLVKMILSPQARATIQGLGRQAGLLLRGAETCPYFCDEGRARFNAWMEGYQLGAEEKYLA